MKNILETLKEKDELKNFVELVNLASLDKILLHAGPYTIFAPDDEAFLKIGEKLWSTLRKDNSFLVQVVSYHIVIGFYYQKDFKKIDQMDTLATANLPVEREAERIMIDGGFINKGDIEASNGIIHIVDSLLMPPELSTRYPNY